MSKARLIAQLRQQTDCLIHLARQLTPEQADFRLTPPQRSTIELLRYLCTQNPGVVDFIITGGWDRWEHLDHRHAGLGLAAIPEALRASQRAVEEALAPWSDARLESRRVRMFWGEVLSMHDAIEASAVRYTIGYTMQVFLQAKAAGLSGIGTSDVWYGRAKAQAT